MAIILDGKETAGAAASAYDTALKNLSDASTLIKFTSSLFPNTFSTSSDSFFLNKPWSTNIHVKLFPIALLIKAAATEESTPPDKANRTFLSPTCSLTNLICFSINGAGLFSPFSQLSHIFTGKCLDNWGFVC